MEPLVEMEKMTKEEWDLLKKVVDTGIDRFIFPEKYNPILAGMWNKINQLKPYG